MSKIQVLPEEIRAKIAAGEVIERPASVIKELVENALDAGAKKIRVELNKGGFERISVYDDGEGLAPEDLRLCYLPFATSKIKNLSDLFSLATYGFRGEALSSIAQVSRLRILSLQRGGDLPFEILIEFGKEVAFRPARIKEGTLIEVRDLFENLPARRAFLKSTKTETAKNLEIIKALMLTHPELAFKVIIDGKETLNWPGGDLKELFETLFEISPEFLSLSKYERSPYEITLLLTDTRKTFSHGRFLFFMVNHRLLQDSRLTRIFYHLLKRYFGALGFPGGILEITLPPQLVDFNVHPAKWEVRFKAEGEVYKVLEEALESHFRIKRVQTFRETPSPGHFKIKEDLPLEYPTKTGPSPSLGSRSLFEEAPLFSFKIIGSFKQTYLLVEKGEDLLVVDQHALSERIHYETLKRRAPSFYPQRLLLPFLITLTPEMQERLEEKLLHLSELGFEVEMAGEATLLVKGAPSELSEFAQEVLESFLLSPGSNLNEARDYFLKELACRLARKKGDFLSEEEKTYLVKEMFKEGLETCPHGRPLFFRLTLPEIERRLKRRL
jgi:DNA mismatch repair protein MutL